MDKQNLDVKNEADSSDLKNDNVVRMNLYREDYQLEEVLGSVTFSDEVLDYIADKCVQMIMKDYE